MTNALEQFGVPGIGHNSPPEPPSYREELAEKAKPLVMRSDALLKALNNSKISDEAGVEAVTALGGLIREHREKVEDERVELKSPWDTGAATVQGMYKPVIDTLDAALKTAAKMIDDWKEQERARLRKEQEAAAAIAEAERRAAEEAAAKLAEAQSAGDADAVLEAELQLMQHQGAADAAEEAVPTITPSAPIRTQTGMAASRTQKVPVINDARKAVNWLFKNRQSALIEVVKPLIAQSIRGGMTVDGVSVVEEQKTHFRR